MSPVLDFRVTSRSAMKSPEGIYTTGCHSNIVRFPVDGAFDLLALVNFGVWVQN